MNYNLGTARGNIDIDTTGLQGAQVALYQTGYALTALGGAMVGAVGYVIKTSAEFEKSMSAVSAITGETGANMDLLREKALELGKRGPYGPNQVAAAFIELGKAGLTTQEILEGVGESTVNLAAAGDLELARAGEILSNTLRAFQLEASEAARVTDILAGAANASTIDVEDLAVSLRYVGGVANAIGIPLEDVADGIAYLGNVGIKGSTAGTALRRILLNLQPASEKAGDAMKELGIINEEGANAFFTAEGKAKPLAEILQILQDKTAGLNDQQKLAAINTIFGARASAAALQLMRGGAEGLAEVNDLINRTTAEEVAAKRLDNLAGSITKLKAALEAVFIEAGAPFQRFLKGIVDGIRAVVLAFGEMPRSVQTGILIIIALVGAFTLLTGVIFLILAPMLNLIRLFALLPESLAVLRGGFALATTAVRGFTFALLTNPVFLIIAAIVALGVALVALYKNWEPFRDFVDGLWQGIQKVWDAALGFFEDLPGRLAGILARVRGPLTEVFDWIKENWQDVLLTLAGPLPAVANVIADNWEKIPPLFNSAKDAVSGLFGSFESGEEAVQEFVEQTTGTISKVPGEAKKSFDQTKAEAGTFREGMAKEGNDSGMGFLQSIDLALALVPFQAGLRLGELIGRTIVGLSIWVNIGSSQAQAFILNVGAWFAQLPSTVMTWILQTLTNLVQVTPFFWAIASDLGGQFFARVVDWFRRLPGEIIGIMTGILNFLVGLPLQMFSIGLSIGLSLADAIGDGIAQIPGLFGDIFGKAIDVIKGLAKRAAEAAKGFAAGVWQGIKNGLDINSPSNVEEAFFAMDDNVTASLAHMVGEISQLARLNAVRSTFGGAVTQFQSSATPTTPQAAATAGSPIIVQGPLVEVAEAVIRETEDITRLSRSLATHIELEQRAQGKKVLNA